MTAIDHGVSRIFLYLSVCLTGLASAHGQIEFEPVVTSGAPVKVMGTDYEFARFSNPTMSASGVLLFEANQEANGVVHDALWRVDEGLSLLARSLEQDSSGSQFLEFGGAIADRQGNIAFHAIRQLFGWLSTDQLHYVPRGEGRRLIAGISTLAPSAYDGNGDQIAPEFDGVQERFARLGQPRFDVSGRVHFTGLISGSGIGVREGLFYYVPPLDSHDPLARSDKVYFGIVEPRESALRRRLFPAKVSSTGRVVFKRRIDTTDPGNKAEGIFTASNYGLPEMTVPTVYAGEGLAALGSGQFASLGAVHANGSRFAFWASLNDGTKSVESLWQGEIGKPLIIRATEGDSAGWGAYRFIGFSEPLLLQDGTLLFHGWASDGGNTKDGIWYKTPDSTPMPLLKAGDTLSGYVVRSLGSPIANEFGQVTCTALLSSLDGSRRLGWCYGAVSESMALGIVEGRVISDAGVPASPVKSFRASKLSHRGEVAVALEFDSGLAQVVKAFLPDHHAPNPPTGLVSEIAGKDVIKIVWDASTDNNGVQEYIVYRDSVEIARTVKPEYLDKDVDLGDYVYAVRAVDFSGNLSDFSNELETAPPATLFTSLLDNTDDGFALESGTWGILYSGDTKFGSDGRYSTNPDSATASWSTDLPGSGFYELQVWLWGSETRKDWAAKYEISTASGNMSVKIDQNTTGPGWVSLGVFRINQGSSTLRVSRSNEAGLQWYQATVADAARWILLDTDATPPTAPPEVSVTEARSTSVDLEWLEGWDDVGVKEYVVFRDDVEVWRGEGTHFLDRSVLAGTPHSYRVGAVDFRGNMALTDPVVVTPPRALDEFVVDNDDSEFTLEGAWGWKNGGSAVHGLNGRATNASTGASARWNHHVPVRGTYEVMVWLWGNDPKRDWKADYAVTTDAGDVSIEVDQNNAAPGWVSLGVFQIDAGLTSLVLTRDEEGGVNQHYYTIADAAKWVLLDTDVEPPSAPSDLAVEWKLHDRALLSWSPSSDDIGIKEYRVFRDGVLAATLNSNSWLDTNIAPGNTYRYVVRAFDYAGNAARSVAYDYLAPSVGPALVFDNRSDEYTESPNWFDSFAIDSHSVFSRATITVGATAEWRPNISLAGWHEVFVWVSGTSVDGSPAIRDRLAKYTVTHASGTDEVLLDQNVKKGAWRSIGVWRFDKGTAGAVRVTRTAESLFGTIADGIRFLPIFPQRQIHTSDLVHNDRGWEVNVQIEGGAFPVTSLGGRLKSSSSSIDGAVTRISDQEVRITFSEYRALEDWELVVIEGDSETFATTSPFAFSQPMEDTDGDGLIWAFEHALGTDPENPADGLESARRTQGEDFTFVRRKGLLDVAIIPEISVDLVNWVAVPEDQFRVVDRGDGTEEVFIEIPQTEFNAYRLTLRTQVQP